MDTSTQTIPGRAKVVGRGSADGGLRLLAAVLFLFVAWDAYWADWSEFGKDAFVLASLVFLIRLHAGLPDDERPPE